MISQMRFHASPSDRCRPACRHGRSAGSGRVRPAAAAACLGTIERGPPPSLARRQDACATGHWATPGSSSRSSGSAATTSAAGSTRTRPAPVVDAAIDGGITLLDTAETYGGRGRSEEILGEVLAGRRDQVVLATKFGPQGADMGYGPAAGAKGGRGYISRAVEQSLRRLRTDYIDLYQIHTPDPVTPIEETLAALTELVQAGLVRYIGHSNFSGVADRRSRRRRPASWRGCRSSPRRITGRCWNGRPSSSRPGRRAVRPRRAALLPAGQRPADRQGQARRRRPPRARRLADRADYITDEKLDKVEALADWATAARPVAARGRHRRAGGAAGLRLGDRRGHLGRAGTGQRGRRRLGADCQPSLPRSTRSCPSARLTAARRQTMRG